MTEPKKNGGPRTEGAPALHKLVEAGLIGAKDRILCYGCGYGADVSWFRARKFNVQGYDPHPPFGFAELPLGKFDWVFLIYLMSRLKTEEQRRGVLFRAANYVRPGGYLTIVTRHGSQWAETAGQEGRAGAAAYFRGLIEAATFEAPETSDFETEDRALCIRFRRTGIYQPHHPIVWIDDPAMMAAVCAELRHLHPAIALDV